VQAQANFYTFSVPRGAANIHADIQLANDPNDVLTGYLIDPSGQNLGYSTNVTATSLKPTGHPIITRSVDLYHARPTPGRWVIALQWANPVSGLELKEPFKGTIGFGKLPITNNLPVGARLTRGKTVTFHVTIKNTGKAPEAYFLDPRLNSTFTLTLPNQNNPMDVNAASLTLPLTFPSDGNPPFPYYLVPTQTTKISESVTASAPVNFDSSYFPGDPDLEGTQSGNSASLSFSNPEVSPGLWTLIPSEIGPYPSTGAPAVTAAATFQAVTKQFDRSVTSPQGDLWPVVEGLPGNLGLPVFVQPGKTVVLTVHIKPGGRHGSRHAGTLYIDDMTVAGFFVGFDFPNTDEIAAIPYHYITR
jgi:hypothetical protein